MMREGYTVEDYNDDDDEDDNNHSYRHNDYFKELLSIIVMTVAVTRFRWYLSRSILGVKRRALVTLPPTPTRVHKPFRLVRLSKTIIVDERLVA